MDAKNRRQKVLSDARRGMVLDAAREVFARQGLERTSMREIAKQAGYTPGALYAFFASKADLLVSLMEDLLSQLLNAVSQAKSLKPQAEHMLLARGNAWIAFFTARPRDLELTLHVLAGANLQAMPPELAARLHPRLRDSLFPLAQVLLAQGADPVEVDREMEALLAHGMGLLLSQDSTRLQSPDHSPEALFAAYLTQVARRHLFEQVPAQTLKVAQPPQVDLFR
jgi:AcrR family transcriptional regulator